MKFVNFNEGLNEILISATDNSENHNEITERISVNYYPFGAKINSPNDLDRYTPEESMNIYGEITKKGTLGTLTKTAIRKKKIPGDTFSKKILHTLNSHFARKRIEEGSAHSAKSYSNEKNARLVLNLVMVFLQHCIQL